MLTAPAAPPASASASASPWWRRRPAPTTDSDGTPDPADPYPVGEAPTPPPAPAPPPAAPTPAPPPVYASGGGGTAPGLDQTIQDKILALLSQGPVDPNDPALRDVMNSHRVASGRAFDRNRAMMAERRAAQGLAGSGAFETGLMGLAQQRGEGDAAFSANLVREAQIQRATEIMQALTLGQGRIDAQAQRALQAELANLQASIQRAGMEQQGHQFDRSYDLDMLRLLLQGVG